MASQAWVHRTLLATSGWLVAGAVVALLPRPLPAAPPEELAADQDELAKKYGRLETLAKRIAELAEAEDPDRAEQLRGAIRRSQELALPERFAAVVGLLEKEQLAAAADGQVVLAEQLRQVLTLLLEDPARARDEAKRKRLQAALKTLGRQIRTQRQLRAESAAKPAGADAGELADRQSALGKEAGELGKQVGGEPAAGGDPSAQGSGDSGGGDSGGESPSAEQRAAERLGQAQQQMQQAADALREAQQEPAKKKTDEAQAAAQRKLEDAKAELEQALRQLREEELQRKLTQLATRLRRMLAEQTDILKLTKEAQANRQQRGRRATRTAARGLANREDELARQAGNALRLLTEDGRSIAFPEILSQVGDDMRATSERLRDARLGTPTQRLQEDIIASLAEAVESLDKTIEDLQRRKEQGQRGAPSGSPGEPPLVDKLAELRMIRTLQARILRKTEFWDELRRANDAEESEAKAALTRLADRQRRLIQAVRSIDSPPGP